MELSNSTSTLKKKEVEEIEMQTNWQLVTPNPFRRKVDLDRWMEYGRELGGSHENKFKKENMLYAPS